MDALDNLSLLKFSFWDATNAVGSEVSVAGLNASKAAEILVARFLPFSYEVGVSDAFFQAVFIELAGYDFATVEHVVDVAGFLVMNLEDRPQ